MNENPEAARTAATRATRHRETSHRIAAHRMAARGQRPDSIADTLRVSLRTVYRYLEATCPDDPPATREVSLKDFFMQGACGSFPEMNWQTRALGAQAQCKAVCTHCPVLTSCRTYGLTTGLQQTGIWGGLNHLDRLRAAAATADRGDDSQGVA